MSNEQLALLSLLATPIAAIITAFITAKVMRSNSKDSTKPAQQEADTNEFRALTEGFTESFRQMNLRIQNQDTRISALEADKRDLQQEKITLLAAAQEDTKERAAILAFIEQLELGYPDPPGPPPRPEWRKSRV